MSLSHSARMNKRGSLAKAGHYEEDAIKLDIVNIVHQEENIYLDVFYHNSSSTRQRAYYRKTQDTAILEKPSDYKCYIASFEINSNRFHMFTNSNFNLTFALYYYPDNLTSTRTPLKTLYPNNYEFYSQYAVLNNPDGINLNIVSAFNDIVSQYEVIYGPGSWIANGNPINPPFITYDSATGFFKVYNDVDSSDNNSKAVQLYISPDFNNLIGGLPLDNPPINAYGFNSTTLIPPNYSKVTFEIATANSNIVTVNSNDYVEVIQAYRTLPRWWIERSLYLTSDSIGIRSHYVAQSAETPTTVYRNILLPLDIINDDRGENPKGGILKYIPTADYFYVDITKDNALKVLEFEILYADVFGNIFGSTLNPGDSFSFTLVFVKKV